MKKHVYLSLIWGLFFLIMPAMRAHAQYPLYGYCGRETVYNNDSTNLFWQVDTTSRVLTITGVGRMKDYSTDTRGPWYPWREKIDQILIGDGVATVGTFAFYEMLMDSVRFGNNIEHIYEHAFFNCDSLLSVYLGNNVRKIDYMAFATNDKLQIVDFGESPAETGDHSFAYNGQIRSIRCSKVRLLDWCTFEGCSSLTSLTLGDSLQILDTYAFIGCHLLQSVYIPASVVQINGSPFTYAYALESIEVDSNNPYFDSRNNCNAIMGTQENRLVCGCKNTIIPAETSKIGVAAFEGCIGLTNVVIPAGVKSVESNAFYSCSNLQSVIFPNSITYAGCNVFTYCYALTQPVYNDSLFVYLPQHHKGAYAIPNGIQTVCCGAVKDCDSITSVSIPNSVKEIGSGAFQDCDNLQSVNLSDSITYIPSFLFYGCLSLQSITIPCAVTQIREYAFHYCYALQHITWNPRDARLVGIFYDANYPYEVLVRDNYFESEHPFYNIRRQITSFTFGDSVQVIPRYLCYGMENLSAVSFGCEVDSIEQHVFEGCNGIKSIHWNARSFKDPYLSVYSPFYPIRDSITSFTFGDSVHHIPAYICNGMSNLHQLVIPAKVSSIGEYAFRHMGTLDSISVNPANTHYDSRGNCNALIETASNNLLLGNYKTRIPADIQGIDACAFRNVRNLTTAIIPEGVSFIGKEAFNGCKDLKNLSLPRKLGAINDYTFQDCDSLYTLSLPDSLWYIGLRAFSNCTHLQDITLPESIELIDQYAFSGCNRLRNITCNAPEPPSIQETTFRGTSCPIYVQCPSIMAYRSAPVWKDYGTRVSGLFFNTLSVRPNDYSFGRVYIRQQPDCEHNAILEADPILGYEFVSWQDTLGNVLSKDLVYEFTLDEDKSIIAEFIRKPNALEDMESTSRIWVQGHEIKVLSELNTQAKLYDLMGHEIDRCIVEAGVESSMQVPVSGVYVVITDNNQQKVIVQ